MGSVTGKKQREYYKKLRDRLLTEEVFQKSELIRKTISQFKQFKEASTILYYYAKGNEVRTLESIQDAISLGKQVALPVSHDDGMIDIHRIINPDLDLCLGKYGIMEPTIERCSILYKEQIDIVFVPGLVFDLRGGRLGWGKGYYDRFLKDSSFIKVGLCFEMQVVDQLQLDPQDILVDMLITEKNVYSFHEPKKNDADSFRRR